MINLGFFVLCLIRMLILCIDMVTRWPSHLANLCYFAKSKKTHKTFLNIGYSGVLLVPSTIYIQELICYLDLRGGCKQSVVWIFKTLLFELLSL